MKLDFGRLQISERQYGTSDLSELNDDATTGGVPDG